MKIQIKVHPKDDKYCDYCCPHLDGFDNTCELFNDTLCVGDLEEDGFMPNLRCKDCTTCKDLVVVVGNGAE